MNKKEEKIEPIRDDVEKTLQQAEREWALSHDVAHSSIFNPRDLGIERQITIQQARDNGIMGFDIQKAIDKLERKQTPSKARLHVAKVMSEGFYSYLKLRRLLGVPKDSFTITPLRGQRFADCMGLINPGGLVWVRDGNYPSTTKISVKTDVGLRGSGPATKIQASTADMTLVETTNTFQSMIKDITVDLNDYALIGVNIKDAWLANVKAKIINFKVNAKGVHIQTTSDLWQAPDFGGCYFHNVNLYVPNGEGKPSGTIGIHIERTAGTSTPNHNQFSGRIFGLAYGLKVTHGGAQICEQLDCSDNNYGFWFGEDSIGNVMNDCYAENNTNYEIYLTKGANVIIIGGGISVALNGIFVESDATKTAQYIWLRGDFIKVAGKYNASAQHAPPYIEFLTDGNNTVRLEAKNGIIRIKYAASGYPYVSLLNEPSAGAIRMHRVDESEIGGLYAGSNKDRPVLKFWDVTANAWKYAYINNGAWVIAASMPT